MLEDDTPIALRPPKLFSPYERKAEKSFIENFKYVGNTLMGNAEFEKFMPPKTQKWDPDSVIIKVRNTIDWEHIGNDHTYNMVVGGRQIGSNPLCREPEALYYCAHRGIPIYMDREVGYKCSDCLNEDPKKFIENDKEGDVVCTMCGLVVVQRKTFSGDYQRHFEEDGEDKRHYGMASNPLLSSETNMRTDISAAGGTKKRTGLKQISKVMDSRDTHRLSYGGTHQAYRDNMIIRAIDVASKLADLSGITVQEGLVYFSRFRNFREHVHKFNRAMTCCIALACYDSYLKQKKYEDDVIREQQPCPCDACGIEFATPKDISKHKLSCTMIPMRKRIEAKNKTAKYEEEAKRRWELTTRSNFIDFSMCKKKKTKRREPNLFSIKKSKM